MDEILKEVKYSEILKINGNSRWKTDKVIEYYEAKEKLIPVFSKTPNDQNYVVNFLTSKDLEYRAIDFEPPIGKREWIAWGLLLVSILANVFTAIFSC